jgi:hypothetical protein
MAIRSNLTLQKLLLICPSTRTNLHNPQKGVYLSPEDLYIQVCCSVFWAWHTQARFQWPGNYLCPAVPCYPLLIISWKKERTVTLHTRSCLLFVSYQYCYISFNALASVILTCSLTWLHVLFLILYLWSSMHYPS